MLLSLVGRLFPSLIKPKYYLSICCIVKDENSYLEEWMNYHLKIGVQHFFIYDNESILPIKNTLRELNLLQYATVTSIKGQSMQKKAYKRCLKTFGVLSRWIGFIDIDEFIVPKSTNGNMPLFLKNYEAYGGLGINWLIFGSGGHKQKTNQSQLMSFILRSDLEFSPNSHIKSIVQPQYVQSVVSAHAFIYKKELFCVNENFAPIDDAFSPPSVDKIQLNHYYCRSLEEYEEKIKRGRSDDATLKRKLDHFHYHDQPSNKVRDTSICDILNHLNDETKGPNIGRAN